MANFDDAARIGYALEHYDTVEKVTYESGDPDLSAEFRDKNNVPAPMLKYSKRVDGIYYVVEAIPESRYKKFWIVSAYMEGAGTQALNANGLGNTPSASLTSSAPNFNIAGKSEEIKDLDAVTGLSYEDGRVLVNVRSNLAVAVRLTGKTDTRPTEY